VGSVSSTWIYRLSLQAVQSGQRMSPAISARMARCLRGPTIASWCSTTHQASSCHPRTGKRRANQQLPHRREAGKRDYRFLDAEELVERLDGDGTRKLVRGPDGWFLGAVVRCSNRFHLRCKSRCRSRGYWRVVGTGNLPFCMIQKPCQRRIVPPGLR
jgi:hypothetical protein